MADDELVEDHERDRFADVSDTTADRDGDGHTVDDRARDATTGEDGPHDRAARTSAGSSASGSRTTSASPSAASYDACLSGFARSGSSAAAASAVSGAESGSPAGARSRAAAGARGGRRSRRPPRRPPSRGCARAPTIALTISTAPRSCSMSSTSERSILSASPGKRCRKRATSARAEVVEVRCDAEPLAQVEQRPQRGLGVLRHGRLGHLEPQVLRRRAASRAGRRRRASAKPGSRELARGDVDRDGHVPFRRAPLPPRAARSAPSGTISPVSSATATKSPAGSTVPSGRAPRSRRPRRCRAHDGLVEELRRARARSPRRRSVSS